MAHNKYCPGNPAMAICILEKLRTQCCSVEETVCPSSLRLVLKGGPWRVVGLHPMLEH